MFGICLRYGRNQSEAEEILQKGFIHLFSHLHQFKFEGSLEGWVRRVFVTTAINYYAKRLKFRRNVEYADDKEYSMVQEDPASALSTKELLGIIQSLPEGYRAVFNLYVFENYEHKEIAELLGISAGASKSQLNRARNFVKSRLDDGEKRYNIAYAGIMEDKDPIEESFRSALSDLEAEPPARVWESLHMQLHPLPKPAGIWGRVATFSLLADKPISFYFALSSAAIIFFVGILYFGSGGHATVRGHAYAGAERLTQGTSVLFEVADQAMPWDSVTYYRSAKVDHYGHFQFTKVDAGRYLMRVDPGGNSELASAYLPTWFDRHAAADSGRLIMINRGDVNLDAHLLKK